MKYILFCCFTSFIMFFSECKTTAKTNQTSTSTHIKKQSDNVLQSQKVEGNMYKELWNSSQTLLLMYELPDIAMHRDKQFTYVVYAKDKKTILKKGRFIQGHVKWINDNTLEILERTSSNDIEGRITQVFINSQ